MSLFQKKHPPHFMERLSVGTPRFEFVEIQTRGHGIAHRVNAVPPGCIISCVLVLIGETDNFLAEDVVN